MTLQNLTIDGANNGVAACTPAIVGILYQDAAGTVLHVATRNQTLAATLGGCDSENSDIASKARRPFKAQSR